MNTRTLAIGLGGSTLAATLLAATSCASTVATGPTGTTSSSAASVGAGFSGSASATTSQGSTSGQGGSIAGSGGHGGSGAGTGGQSSSTTVGQGGGVACTAVEKAMKWSAMVQAPIKLPGQAAMLDLTGPLTLQSAEQLLCQGLDLGDQFGDGSRVEAWGDNQEVFLDYDPTTMAGNILTLFPGYLGALSFHGANGTDVYSITVQSQVIKNGQPFTVSGWSAADAQFAQEADELCRGLMATFTNAALDPVGTTCLQSGKCTLSTFGTVGALYFKPVGLGVWVNDVTAPQPAPSTPGRLDVYKL